MAKTRPTQRTLKALKDDGRICAIVEKWVPMHFKREEGENVGGDGESKRPMGFRKDLFGFIDVIQVQSKTDFFGHSYFVSNPEVSADLIALLRYGLGPNDPGRSLEVVEKPFWRIPEGQGTGAAP